MKAFTSINWVLAAGALLLGNILGASQAMANLSALPTSQAFGSVTIGATSSRSFTFTNVGIVPITGINLSFTGTGSQDLSVIANPGSCGETALILGADESCTVDVQLSPSVSGSVVAKLVFSYNNTQSMKVSLSGSKKTPSALSFINSALDNIGTNPPAQSLGSAFRNASKSTLLFKVFNSGQAVATGVYLSQGPAPSPQFTIKSNACGTLAKPISLPGGKMCSFYVVFAPHSYLGELQDTFSLTHAGQNVGNLLVSGNSTATASLEFLTEASPTEPVIMTALDNATAGGVGSTQTITVKNNGGQSAQNVFVAQSVLGPYTVDMNTCGVSGFETSLTPSETCSFRVIFSPTKIGTASGAVTVSYGNGASATTSKLTLAGTGIAPATLSLSKSLHLGSSIIGSNTDSVITITNIGSTAATNISIQDANQADEFDLETNGPALPGTDCSFLLLPLAPLGTCTFTVKFQPVLGSITNPSDVINIQYNNGGGETKETQITIKGSVRSPAALAISSSAKNFGVIVVGNSSFATFTLRNTGQTTATNVYIPALSGVDNGGSLNISNETNLCGGGQPAGFSLSPGQKCTFVVRYMPITPGLTQSDSIKLNYNDGLENHTNETIGSVQGESSAPITMAVSSPSLINDTLDFGTIGVGNLATRTFTIQNTHDLNATKKYKLLVSGAGFSLVSDGAKCGGAVTAGASCSYVVSLKSTIEGPVSGSITMEYNNGVSLTQVPVATLTGSISSVGLPVAMVFKQTPSTSTAGLNLSTPPIVHLIDGSGHTVTNAPNTSITMSIYFNASEVEGNVLAGKPKITAVKGVAKFSSIHIPRSGFGYTLQASAPGFASIQTTSFNVLPQGVSNFAAEIGADNAQFTFTAAPGVTECSIDSSPFSPCASPVSYFGLTPNTYEFAVRTSDPFDQLGAKYSFDIAGGGGGGLSLEITSPNGGENFETDQQSQIISGTCSTNIVHLNSMVNAMYVPFSDSDCSDGTWALEATNLSSGPIGITISGYSAGYASFTTDSMTITYTPGGGGAAAGAAAGGPPSPPTIAITSPNGGVDFATSTQEVTISGTCSIDTESLLGMVRGWPVSFTDDDCADGNWALEPITLTNGGNNITLTANKTGAASAYADLTITYASAPNIAITSPVNGENFSTDTQAQIISGTCDAGVTLDTNIGTFSDSDCVDGTWALNSINFDNNMSTTLTVTASRVDYPTISASDSIRVTYCSSLNALTDATSFGGGTGDSNDPYQIATAGQLSYMRSFLDNTSVYFKLISDIDLKCFNWIPVGNTVSPSTAWFKGSFDGDYYTIYNLYVSQAGVNAVGLFGAIGSGAVVKKVMLDGVNVSGANRVGGLVGFSGSSSGTGTITDSMVTGIVVGTGSYVGLGVGYQQSGTATELTSGGYVEGVGYVGGVVGGNLAGGYTAFSDLSSSAAVKTVNSNFAGGIIGNLDSATLTVSNLTFTGAITATAGSATVGGLIGNCVSGTPNAQVIQHSSVSSSASITAGSGNAVGGLVGTNAGCKVYASNFNGTLSASTTAGSGRGGAVGSMTNSGSIVQGYSTGSVTGFSNVGGLVGSLMSGTSITNSYSSGAVRGYGNNIGGFLGAYVSTNFGTVTNAYSVSSVTSEVTSTNVGQFGGACSTSTFNDSFAIDGISFCGGGTPTLGDSGNKSAGDLKQQSTFTNWSFQGLWSIEEGVSYPTIQ